MCRYADVQMSLKGHLHFCFRGSILLLIYLVIIALSLQINLHICTSVICTSNNG
jgi:hypothetical protein